MKARKGLVVLGTLALAVTVQAQFDFGRLKKGLEQAAEKAADVAKVARGATASFTLEQEQFIGDAVALEIVARFGGLWRDEAATRRVNLVGGALARYGNRPGLEWRFGVLDSPAVNAFSAPGGWVFITRGLYEQAVTDDLLAGILAHEIVHITEKHALKIIGQAEALSVLGEEAKRRSSDIRAADAKIAGARDGVARVSPDVAQFLDTNVSKIVKLLVDNGYSNTTEYAADQGGRSLAEMVGFAPGGLRAVLAALEKQKTNPKMIFSKHPPIKERLGRLPNDPPPPPPATAAETAEKRAGESPTTAKP